MTKFDFRPYVSSIVWDKLVNRFSELKELVNYFPEIDIQTLVNLKRIYWGTNKKDEMDEFLFYEKDIAIKSKYILHLEKLVNKKEIWKPVNISTDADKYWVSNFGNVKSKKCILKLRENRGYYVVHLSKYKDTKTGKWNHKFYDVHTLVALTFLRNEEDKKKTNDTDIIVVNHINGNKLDNKCCNLEWTTQSKNMKHAVATGLSISLKRRVGQYSLDNELIKEYESIKSAAKITGLNDSSISKKCKIENNIYGGFRWKYIGYVPNNDEINLKEFKQIEDFPNYYINSEGKIYSKRLKRLMNLAKNGNRGYSICLSNDSVKKTHMVHRLVGQYFLKKTKKIDNCIRHKNGNKFDNNKNNLEWFFMENHKTNDSKLGSKKSKPKKISKTGPKKKYSGSKSAKKN